jgi:thiosulfate/3-mercaptopyruvate sulfurtransferase
MYKTLISAQQLHAQDSDLAWVILDCRFDLGNPEKGQQAYLTNHIENAQYVNLNEQLSGAINASSGRHPLPEIADITALFSSCGVGENTQVVVYDDCGGAMASRAWWLLQWLGHENVAVLDGGIQAWQNAALPLTTQVKEITAAHFVRHASKFNVITTEQICSGDYQLVDARAAARFNGEVEPIDPVAGHVPGALNHPFNDNLTAQGAFKDSAQLNEMWQPMDKDNLVHMCGSGVTACHNLLAMCHAGLEPSKLYIGSWSEWIRDSARAVAKEA